MRQGLIYNFQRLAPAGAGLGRKNDGEEKERKRAPCAFRQSQGTDTDQYDLVSCVLGCGIFAGSELALVWQPRGVYIAAEHLLDFYYAVRFLHSFLVQASEAGTGSLRGGSSRDGCHMPFTARGQGDFRRTDSYRILYAADGSFEKST